MNPGEKYIQDMSNERSPTPDPSTTNLQASEVRKASERAPPNGSTEVVVRGKPVKPRQRTSQGLKSANPGKPSTNNLSSRRTNSSSTVDPVGSTAVEGTETLAPNRVEVNNQSSKLGVTSGNNAAGLSPKPTEEVQLNEEVLSNQGNSPETVIENKPPSNPVEGTDYPSDVKEMFTFVPGDNDEEKAAEFLKLLTPVTPGPNGKNGKNGNGNGKAKGNLLDAFSKRAFNYQLKLWEPLKKEGSIQQLYELLETGKKAKMEYTGKPAKDVFKSLDAFTDLKSFSNHISEKFTFLGTIDNKDELQIYFNLLLCMLMKLLKNQTTKSNQKNIQANLYTGNKIALQLETYLKQNKGLETLITEKDFDDFENNLVRRDNSIYKLMTKIKEALSCSSALSKEERRKSCKDNGKDKDGNPKSSLVVKDISTIDIGTIEEGYPTFPHILANFLVELINEIKPGTLPTGGRSMLPSMPSMFSSSNKTLKNNKNSDNKSQQSWRSKIPGFGPRTTATPTAEGAGEGATKAPVTTASTRSWRMNPFSRNPPAPKSNGSSLETGRINNASLNRPEAGPEAGAEGTALQKRLNSRGAPESRLEEIVRAPANSLSSNGKKGLKNESSATL